MTSSLFKRWITALIAGPLVILVVLYGSTLVFAAFVGLITVLAALEYGWMTFGRKARTELAEGILCSLVLLAAAYSGQEKFLVVAITGTLIWSIISYMLRYQRMNIQGRPDLAILGKTIFGFIGLPLLLAHLILLRNIPSGILWILLMFLIVISGDIAAFFVGTKFGRNKLMPAISPAKTREGAVASLLAGMAVAGLYAWYFIPELSIAHLLALSAITNILAQLGDLSESMIKRAAGAKDSGSLLPGHGGVLDRIDAFFFAAPFVYYYKVILIG